MPTGSDLQQLMREIGQTVREHIKTQHQQLTADTADAIAEQLRPMKARMDKLEQQLSSANKQLAALEKRKRA